MIEPASTGSPSNATPSCKVCLEPILLGAKKCTKCDSFQDWRRFFGINTVVLSLLVALISIITSAAPVLKDLLTPNADVRISVLDAASGRISTVVSNLGTRVAILRSASLEIEPATGKAPFALKWEGSGLLEPGKDILVPFAPTVGGAMVPLPIGDTCTYRINLDVIAFNHRTITPRPTALWHCVKP